VSAITTLLFRVAPVSGNIGATTQANPYGFSGKSFYYEILDRSTVPANTEIILNINPLNNTGIGGVIGVIAYHSFHSRWAILFTHADALNPNDNTTYVINVQWIKDFLTAIQNGNLWPQPVTTGAIGNALNYAVSLPPIEN
jgi:hypothetical protein